MPTAARRGEQGRDHQVPAAVGGAVKFAAKAVAVKANIWEHVEVILAPEQVSQLAAGHVRSENSAVPAVDNSRAAVHHQRRWLKYQTGKIVRASCPSRTRGCFAGVLGWPQADELTGFLKTLDFKPVTGFSTDMIVGGGCRRKSWNGKIRT